MLPRLVGLRRAMELVLLNPRLDASRALELGLINAVLRRDRSTRTCGDARDGRGRTDRRAFAIAKGACSTRRPAWIGWTCTSIASCEHLSRIADGAEFQEGLDGFFAKRRAARSHGVSPMHEYSIVAGARRRAWTRGACAQRHEPCIGCTVGSASCRASTSVC